MRLYTEYAINKMHMVNVAQGYLYINRVISLLNRNYRFNFGKKLNHNYMLIFNTVISCKPFFGASFCKLLAFNRFVAAPHLPPR